MRKKVGTLVHTIHSGAIALLLILTMFLAGCPSPAPVPSNVTYRRVPTAVKRVVVAPEVMTVDNCASSSSLERWLERGLTLGEVVSFNWEEAEAVATTLGLSFGVGVGVFVGMEAGVGLQNEISRQFGTGLTSGQTKTQGVKIAVGPRQTAVTTLQWIETWEDGYVEVFYDGQYAGTINYHLLVDLRLDSATKTYDCTLLGRARQTLAAGVARARWGIRSTYRAVSQRLTKLATRTEDQWRVARDAWPWGRLEWWIAGVVVVIGGLVMALIRKRQLRRIEHWGDDFYA